MKSILLEIRSKYGEMGPGEKKIANCLIENPSCILPLSISEFAAKAGCGDATAIRFARRLGLKGYQDLKIAIAGEVSTLSREREQISKDDSCFDMFSKRINDIQIALENTRSVLDPEDLERAANAIMNAEQIVIFGLGNSSPIAIDAQYKFLRIGLNCSACSDSHLQVNIASHLNERCVAIGVSHSGRSVDVVEVLRLSRLSGATTICVTNHDVSPITQVSDICLFTKSEETKYTNLSMSSRVAVLAIFDSIYTYIVANSNRTAGAISATEMGMKSKKI